MSIQLPIFDPILIFSVVAMQIGARYLDLELTEFQKKLIKNKVVQTFILLGLIYIPIRVHNCFNINLFSYLCIL